MPVGAIVSGAASIGGALIGAHASKKAAKQAAASQQKAIDQNNTSLTGTTALYQPYLNAGTGAVGQLADLAGANGFGAQSAGIANVQASPYYQSLYRNGEEAVLQNASATGGLRGGNTQRSLANFGADTLAQAIQQQLANLGGVSNIGLGATNSLGAIRQTNANANGQYLTNQGQAQAAGTTGQAAAFSNGLNGLAGAFGGGGGLNLGSLFGSGGGGSAFAPSTFGAGIGTGAGYGANPLGSVGYQAPFNPGF